MPNLIYQANFCAECGVSCQPRRTWWPRYFCDDCSVRLRRQSLFNPLGSVIVIFCSLVAVWAWRSTAPASAPDEWRPSAKETQIYKPVRSQEEPASAPVSVKVFCGARTRRGTPCRHLVSPGQRCAQHRGQPSIVSETAPPRASSPTEPPISSSKP